MTKKNTGEEKQVYYVANQRRAEYAVFHTSRKYLAPFLVAGGIHTIA